MLNELLVPTAKAWRWTVNGTEYELCHLNNTKVLLFTQRPLGTDNWAVPTPLTEDEYRVWTGSHEEARELAEVLSALMED